MGQFLHKDETYRILGACFEVYNEKGCGFLEAVYQECLEIELGIQGIPFEAKKPLTLTYKGHKLDKKYEPDFLCFGRIILEIKAVSSLCDDHRAQLLNYLSASSAGPSFSLSLSSVSCWHQLLKPRTRAVVVFDCPIKAGWKESSVQIALSLLTRLIRRDPHG